MSPLEPRYSKTLNIPQTHNISVINEFWSSSCNYVFIKKKLSQDNHWCYYFHMWAGHHEEHCRQGDWASSVVLTSPMSLSIITTQSLDKNWTFSSWETHTQLAVSWGLMTLTFNVWLNIGSVEFFCTSLSVSLATWELKSGFRSLVSSTCPWTSDLHNLSPGRAANTWRSLCLHRAGRKHAPNRPLLPPKDHKCYWGTALWQNPSQADSVTRRTATHNLWIRARHGMLVSSFNTLFVRVCGHVCVHVCYYLSVCYCVCRCVEQMGDVMKEDTINPNQITLWIQ